MAIQLIRGIHNIVPFPNGCIVTIGNFDGIHIGHQALLVLAKERAKSLQLPVVAITFEPLPREFFLRDDSVVPRLMCLREKITVFAQLGIDKVLILPFNAKLANLSAAHFVKQVLGALATKHVVIGDDFRFGHRQEGNFAFLLSVGKNHGFTVERMPSVFLEGERVSSTRVRQALAEANHALVGRLLKRPYHMQGRVVYGHQRGRLLGFPTANIYLQRQVIPVQGVYVVRLHSVAEKNLPGVANVGIRPTIGGTRSLLEVHLFNFNSNIYGQEVCVEFYEKLRDEKRFENLDLLKEQINQDVCETREYFVKQGELV